MAKWIVAHRFVNWHNMTDSGIIPLGHRHFITGCNGSGKSTIMDALTVVLFVNRNEFNKANDIKSGKRDGRTLMGYMRAEITLAENTDGEKKNKEYARKGQVVSHLAFEIYDDKKNDFFTVGATFEVGKDVYDSSKIEGKWWIAESTHLKDIPLSVEQDGKKMVQSLSKVKSLLPEDMVSGTHPRFVVFENDNEAKKGLSLRYGICNGRQMKFGSKEQMDRWRKTMMRCIAFKPDSTELKNSDIFVRNTVLEPDDVDETELEDLLIHLQDACNTLTQIQDRQARLQTILDLGEAHLSASKKERLLKAVTCILDAKTLEDELAALDRECAALEADYISKKEQCRKVRDENRTLQYELYQLEQYDEIKAVSPLYAEVKSFEKKISAYEAAETQLKKELEKAKEVADKLNSLWGKRVVEQNRIERAIAGEHFTLLGLQELLQTLSNAEEQVRDLLVEMRMEKDGITGKIADLRSEIEGLRAGRIKPEPAAQTLRETIKREFRNNGVADEPRYLYELLEHKDSSWAAASEAHMGRHVLFGVVVAPENYALAAKTLRDCGDDIAGAILIDTKVFSTEESETVEGTLAANLVTENPFVRQYINYRYNAVELVEDASSSHGKGTYLDANGVRYSAHSLTKLRMPRYSIIGEEARRERLACAQDEIAELERQMNDLRKRNEDARSAQNSFESSLIKDLRSSAAMEQLRQTIELPELRTALQEKQTLLESMKTSPPVMRLNQVRKAIEAKTNEEKEAERAAEAANSQYNKKCGAHDEVRRKLVDAEDSFNEMSVAEPDLVGAANAHLAALQLQFPKRGLSRHKDEVQMEVQQVREEKERINGVIVSKQDAYNTSLGANLPCFGYKSMEAFAEIHDRLCSKELPEAHRQSELYNKQMTDLLYKNVIAHLHTAIFTKAQGSLSQLNRTLKSMEYNNQCYQFSSIKPAKGKEEFFEVIKHFDASVLQNISLFGPTKSEDDIAQEERVIRELLGMLRKPKSDKGENWLDYRTYCEFGIDVISASNPDYRKKLDNSVAQFSGAEVQIPFYMILTASLANIYAQGSTLTAETMSNSNSLRLMMVDECFSKMDTGNTQKLVNFICKEMGLQMISAAPPSTFNSLAGVVDNVTYVKQRGAFRACFSFTAEEFQESDSYGDALALEGAVPAAGA